MSKGKCLHYQNRQCDSKDGCKGHYLLPGMECRQSGIIEDYHKDKEEVNYNFMKRCDI